MLLSVLSNLTLGGDKRWEGEVKFLRVPWCCGSHSLFHPPIPIALSSQHLQWFPSFELRMREKSKKETAEKEETGELVLPGG